GIRDAGVFHAPPRASPITRGPCPKSHACEFRDSHQHHRSPRQKSAQEDRFQIRKKPYSDGPRLRLRPGRLAPYRPILWYKVAVRAVSTAQMQRADRLTIERYGIPILLLMDNA